MIWQTKVLKDVLKQNDVTGPFGDKLKVRITKTKHGEYHNAEAFVSGLNDEKIAAIKASNPRVRIHGVAGCLVWYVTY